MASTLRWALVARQAAQGLRDSRIDFVHINHISLWIKRPGSNVRVGDAGFEHVADTAIHESRAMVNRTGPDNDASRYESTGLVRLRAHRYLFGIDRLAPLEPYRQNNLEFLRLVVGWNKGHNEMGGLGW